MALATYLLGVFWRERHRASSTGAHPGAGAGPAPSNDTARVAAHQSHHALARLYKTKLGEPLRAKEHLEAAFALDPSDLTALDELLPHFRATGRAAELADACEKAGFELVRWWHYFSPNSLHILEWGHYFGLPSWVVHALFGRWILVRSDWNLALTRALVNKAYTEKAEQPQGSYTFYVVRKV